MGRKALNNDSLLGSVELVNVSKRFKKATFRKKSYSTIKSNLLTRLLHGKKREQIYLQALDNLSISIKPGAALGVIGSNGSGKSTLLKLIAGIYRPDTGSVTVNGTISALIELGAGFHPDFTGRENVYLGGVMYGLTRKQIDERFRDIVAYAELEDFIDDPVRTYSSGMYMRLGFSLAVHTDPDILLLDEVLAVGDAHFIHRCHETISDFRRRGKTMLLVTHDLASVVRWCDEAMWLDRGVVKKRGEPQTVIDSYLEAVNVQEQQQLSSLNAELTGIGANERSNEAGRWGNKDVEITGVRMRNAKGDETWLFHGGEAVTVEVDYCFNKQVNDLVFGIGIIRADGVCVHGSNTEIEDVSVPLPSFANGDSHAVVTGTYNYRIANLSLVEDTYYLDVAAHMKDGAPFDYHHRLHKFSVRTKFKQHGVFNPEHRWEFSQAG